jgi:hypothetical protein
MHDTDNEAQFSGDDFQRPYDDYLVYWDDPENYGIHYVYAADGQIIAARYTHLASGAVHWQ